ncbi:kazal-type serine protease inhibitor domain-containing protein [Phthorimaea operculella]|nr:kazal-type serine protease inhibitor domain-containing protein [Phthorimaea operculella]
MNFVRFFVPGITVLIHLLAPIDVLADWSTPSLYHITEAYTTDQTPLQKSSRDVTARQFQSMYMERVEDNLLRNIWEIDDCRCPRVYMPVCGSDHKTYTNICWMNCRNWFKKSKIIIIHKGPCLMLFRPPIQGKKNAAARPQRFLGLLRSGIGRKKKLIKRIVRMRRASNKERT